MDACAKFLLQFKVLFNLLHQLENNNQGGFCYSTLRISLRKQIIDRDIQFHQLLEGNPTKYVSDILLKSTRTFDD